MPEAAHFGQTSTECVIRFTRFPKARRRLGLGAVGRRGDVTGSNSSAISSARRDARRALWDEPDAMALRPPSLRPWVPVPLLDRETLKGSWADRVATVGASLVGSAQPLMTDSTSASSNGAA